MTTPRARKGYLVALLATGITFLLRLVLDPLIDGHPTFVLPLAGVLIAAWYGGYRPGLLAVTLSTISVLVVVVEDAPGHPVSDSALAAALAVYLVVAVASAVLIARLRTTTNELKQTSQRAERTSELLLAAQRASQSGVWAWEPAKGDVYWSREHYHLYGLPEGVAISVQRWIQAIHPDDRPIVGAALESCAQTARRLDVEFRLNREREPNWCRLVGDIVSHTPVRLAGITIDITHQKQTELELKRSNEDLDSFAHVVSHDLREPIRLVTSYAQLIQRRYGAALGDEGGQFLGIILSSIGGMERLVAALLALSSANSRDAQQKSSVDLNNVVRSAVASLQRIAETTDASITWSDLPTVFGNEVVLTQIFQNLIENALKYRRSDELPRIHIEARSYDGHWWIDVKDNGIGFNMESANKLFMPFRRLHAGHQYEGAGIGLATCKRSIERLGGRIEAQSEPGKGSVFTVIVPAVANGSAASRDDG